MLRGPQTAAEISQRTERLHSFGPGEVDETLERLAGRELVARRPPGPVSAASATSSCSARSGESPSAPEPPRIERRLERGSAALEAELERIGTHSSARP